MVVCSFPVDFMNDWMPITKPFGYKFSKTLWLRKFFFAVKRLEALDILSRVQINALLM